MLEPPIEISSLIAERYQVVEQLGSGAFGAVYACKDVALADRVVALKLFPYDISNHVRSRARISQELQCAFRINHDNVVRFYEPVFHEELIGYTMEYISGDTLRSHIGPSIMLPGRAVLDVLYQICSGVRAIHQAGIVHGDLKPENIMYTRDGIVKIADFGLANRLRNPSSSGMLPGGGEQIIEPEAATVYGTLDYVSPEYFTSGRCDERSDIYALGVIAYELIAGRRMFEDSDPFSLVHKKLTRDPPELDLSARSLDGDLMEILRDALMRDPDKRIQSVDEFRDKIRRVLKNTDTVKPPRLDSHASPSKHEHYGRWRTVVLYGAIIVLLFIVLVTWMAILL